MPVKMIATRRYYHMPHRKEYEFGAEFSVATENEADSLSLRKKAIRAEARKSPTDLPEMVMKKGKIVTADMTAEDEPAPVKSEPRPNTSVETEEEPVRPLFGKRKYRRRDQTAE